MNNEFMINLFVFFQTLGLLIVLFDWGTIEAKMKEDKDKLTKNQYKKTWIGRTFILFYPTLVVISLIYKPL